MGRAYPKTFSILTPDGEGEAVKNNSGAPWEISYPTGGLRWFGSCKEAQAEIKRRLRTDYGVGDIVNFGKVLTGRSLHRSGLGGIDA